MKLITLTVLVDLFYIKPGGLFCNVWSQQELSIDERELMAMDGKKPKSTSVRRQLSPKLCSAWFPFIVIIMDGCSTSSHGK
jgi:hypothetical protein